MILKKCYLIPKHKKLSEFEKKITRFKNVNPQAKANEDLKPKVSDNAGDIFNEMYYIYKEKYEEEKDGFNDKDRKKCDYAKLILTDDYEYESEKEEKKTYEKPDKKNHLKNEKKIMQKNLVNWLIKKKQI